LGFFQKQDVMLVALSHPLALDYSPVPERRGNRSLVVSTVFFCFPYRFSL
jgi:hypothetical protein